jgi:hypothetical protein
VTVTVTESRIQDTLLKYYIETSRHRDCDRETAVNVKLIATENWSPLGFRGMFPGNSNENSPGRYSRPEACHSALSKFDFNDMLLNSIFRDRDHDR